MNNFHVDLNSDTFYLVDNVKVYSKIKAIELAKGDISRISFSWMEDTWDSVDWTFEPQESWNQLLKKRCQQIRDKYNYISLWYSSGYDSHTMLRSFVDNNILLDEILIMDRSDFFDDPELKFSISHAKLVKDQYFPNLKINVVKVDYRSLDDFYKINGLNWIYHPGYSLKIAKTHRYFSTQILPEFQNTNNNRGNIMGVDKPKLLLRDGKWFAFCPDGSALDFIGCNQENFYYSSDLPQLNIKQTHMVINWFESLPELNEDLVHDIQGRNRSTQIHYKYYADWNMAMGRFALTNSDITSITGLHKFFSSNDEKSPDAIKFYNHTKNIDSSTFKIYTQGIEIAKQFDNGIIGSAASKTILSKQYYIKNQANQAQ